MNNTVKKVTGLLLGTLEYRVLMVGSYLLLLNTKAGQHGQIERDDAIKNEEKTAKISH